jgi:hypothetical protein
MGCRFESCLWSQLPPPTSRFSNPKTMWDPVSGNLSDGVLGTERIGYAQGALRIISPLAIHEKTVSISSGLESQVGVPDAFPILVQGDWLLLPMREIAHQLDAHCIRRSKIEAHFTEFFDFAFHDGSFRFVFQSQFRPTWFAGKVAI